MYFRLLSKLVFFAFHQYLAPNFHLNNFFRWELYFGSIYYLKWCINIYCFKYLTSYPCFYFLWMFMLCKKEATIFHIYGKKILHIKPFDLSSGLFYRIFEKFNNDLHLWKSEVTIKKGKIFNISLNIAHFPKHFPCRASYLLGQYTV